MTTMLNHKIISSKTQVPHQFVLQSCYTVNCVGSTLRRGGLFLEKYKVITKKKALRLMEASILNLFQKS